MNQSSKIKIILVLVFIFFGGWYFKSRPSLPAPSENFPPAVTITPVLKKSIAPKITFPGIILSPQVANIRPRIEGQVLGIFFKEGEHVQKDQLLFQLDDAYLQAQLEQALATLERDQAGLSFAQAELKRTQILAKREIASLAKFEQAQATVASAQGLIHLDQALIKQIKVQIAYMRITSPLDGRIGFRHVDVGDIIRISDNIDMATVVQLDPIQVQFAIPERYLPLLNQQNKSTPALLRLYSIDHQLYENSGMLYAYENQVEATYGTINAKGQFPNPLYRLTPGQYVTVEMTLYEEKEALILPLEALQTGQSSSYVYIYTPHNQTVHQRLVTAEIIDDKTIKILKGVTDGERVITSGHLKIKDGMKVRPIEKASS